MQKRTFDFKGEIDKCFLKQYSLNEINLKFAKVYDEVFNIATTLAGSKINVVFIESDYVKFGKDVTDALKSACADYSTLLIEHSEFDHAKSKAFFKFDGEVVIAVGNEDLISTTCHYASLQNLACYGILTEPCCEYLFTGMVKIMVNGFPARVKVDKMKEVVIDVDFIKRAKNQAFANSYANVISKMLFLTDYKYRLLVSDEKFDKTSYDLLKKVIYYVASINGYENYKDVLVYGEVVLGKIMAETHLFEGAAVENLCEMLLVYSPSLCVGDALIYSLRVLAETYEVLFVNDVKNLISVPSYNEDISVLEKTTGLNGSYFRKNLSIPSYKRVDLICKVLDQMNNGFKAEIETVLYSLNNIENTYYTLAKKERGKLPVDLQIRKNALVLSPYLSKGQSLLTLARDIGVLRSVQ